MDETLADLDISLAELGEYDFELLRDLAATVGRVPCSPRW
jgi:hypothetical protein